MADNTSGTQGGSQNNSPKQSGLSWSQPSSAAKPVQTGSSAPRSTPLIKPAATPAAQSGTSRRTALLFAGGVIVGGLLAWSWFSLMPEGAVNNNNVPAAGNEESGGVAGGSATTGSNSGSTLPGSTIGSEALVVSSPQDAGLSVVVSSAAITSPTWVVVYETNNGVRGNALGAALFFPQGGDKTINLLRATSPGKTYFLGRHVDNGDKQFSMTLDKPVTNAAGQPVYTELRTR